MDESGKKAILFVDDEQRVLDAIRRSMRAMRGEWDISFAPGGAEALALLGRQPVDVIVSDMRMPEMDGPTLLLEVRKRYPNTVRIVLSGYSDRETVLRSVGIAHQYLSKPCDADELRRVIGRTCELREHLRSESLRQLVSTMSSLPSMPTLYQDLLDELNSPAPSDRRLGEIMERDIGMTAKVLQIVNSAFFGLRRQIASAVEAISLLGQETVMTLVLGSSAFSACEVNWVGDRSIDSFWAESIRVGTLAREIARVETTDHSVQQGAFTAGLLHGVGRLVLASQFPDRYRAVVEAAGGDPELLRDAEVVEFGAHDTQVGAYLLGLWGLPDAIVEAVAFADEPNRMPNVAFMPVTAVHAAKRLAALPAPGARPLALDEEHLAALNLLHRSEPWRDVADRLLAGGAV